VSCTVVDHFQYIVEHSNYGSERFILSFIKAPLAVKVPEEFVCAVDEMDDHAEEGKAGKIGEAAFSQKLAARSQQPSIS
jgi:hypothetical protein